MSRNTRLALAAMMAVVIGAGPVLAEKVGPGNGLMKARENVESTPSQANARNALDGVMERLGVAPEVEEEPEVAQDPGTCLGWLADYGLC